MRRKSGHFSIKGYYLGWGGQKFFRGVTPGSAGKLGEEILKDLFKVYFPKFDGKIR